MHTSLTRVRRALRHLHDTIDDDRGDVPGWVLITLMTAGLPVIACLG